MCRLLCTSRRIRTYPGGGPRQVRRAQVVTDHNEKKLIYSPSSNMHHVHRVMMFRPFIRTHVSTAMIFFFCFKIFAILFCNFFYKYEYFE